MLTHQKGIIAKAADYGGSDKITAILDEHDVEMPLMTRHAKKIKTGLRAQTQLFAYGLFTCNRW